MRILKIQSLPNVKEQSWIDRDEIMLHACFQILQDCIEKEGVDNHCDYEHHKGFIDEIRELNKWWKERQEKEWEDDDKQNEEDEEMLVRLMKVRLFLWT
jgi:hypothetical protein